MKQCSKCNEIKSFEFFRLNEKCLDGYHSWCKQCTNRAKQEWLKNNPDKSRERERKRHAKKMLAKHGDGYVVGDPANRTGGRKKNALPPEESLVRRKARKVCKDAVRRGKLLRLPCFECGSLETEAHHPDYSRPLDVVWLCKPHHKECHV